MPERLNPYANGETWFLPPEGILDGTDFDIARRYIDGARADLAWRATEDAANPELKDRNDAARLQMEALLESQESRLAGGDQPLAALLAHRLQVEVDELNRGERTTVTGQAHLLIERLRQVGHAYYVPRPSGSDFNT